jgi:hypothetical protein
MTIRITPTHLEPSSPGDVRLLSALEGDGYALAQFADDIQQLAMDSGQSPEASSGAVVRAGDGFLKEIWITTDSRPFDRSAGYVRVM